MRDGVGNMQAKAGAMAGRNLSWQVGFEFFDHTRSAGEPVSIYPQGAGTQPFAPASPGSRADQWQWLSQAVAAGYASDGGRIDRPCVDAERSAALSRATVATAGRGVRKPGGGKRQGKSA